MNSEYTITKRYMVCSRCGGTGFEIYQEDRINSKMPVKIKGFHLNMGHDSVKRKCLNCGLENCTNGVLKSG